MRVQAGEGTVFPTGKPANGSQVEAVLKAAATLEGVESIDRDGSDAPNVMV